MSAHDEVNAALTGKIANLDVWADLIDYACAMGVPSEVIVTEILDDVFWEELRENLGELSAADQTLVRMLRGKPDADIASIVKHVRTARSKGLEKRSAQA